MPKYEVGKTYRVVNKPELYRESSLTLTNDGDTFICLHVDADGDGYSNELLYNGKSTAYKRGWCIGKRHLERGTVEEL